MERILGLNLSSWRCHFPDSLRVHKCKKAHVNTKSDFNNFMTMAPNSYKFIILGANGFMYQHCLFSWTWTAKIQAFSLSLRKDNPQFGTQNLLINSNRVELLSVVSGLKSYLSWSSIIESHGKFLFQYHWNWCSIVAIARNSIHS